MLKGLVMSSSEFDRAENKHGPSDGLCETGRLKTPVKMSALQDAIFNSAYFSCIATDEQGEHLVLSNDQSVRREVKVFAQRHRLLAATKM